MTKKNVQCSLVGMGRMMALRAQGRHGFDSVPCPETSRGRQRHGLGEDDGAVGPGMVQVNNIMAREWCPVHNIVGLGRTMLLWA
jgi:hypothetical protein